MITFKKVVAVAMLVTLAIIALHIVHLMLQHWEWYAYAILTVVCISVILLINKQRNL